MTNNNGGSDEGRAEKVLWECLEAMPDLAALQTSTRWSLTLGAQHSYEARSMLLAVFQVLRPRQIIETGTYHGLTSAYMWNLGRLAGSSPQIRTFDICASTLAPIIWKTLHAENDITLIKGDSGNMISQVCEKPQDFVLIDGDHTYQGAKRDWLAIEPLLNNRSIVFFDNMAHSGGCGIFFSELAPLWFHPEMAILTRGLAAGELRSIFAFYTGRLLPVWLKCAGSRRGNELAGALSSLLALLEETGAAEDSPAKLAEFCRKLSSVSSNSEYPPHSELAKTSAQYGVGALSQARRQRILEGLPERLHPWVRRAYGVVKRRHRPAGTNI